MSRAATTLTAIMPVHDGVEPDHLAAALHSLRDQARPADEIIIVEDGPISASLSAVLDAFETERPECQRLRLATNCGSGAARQVGLDAASGEWIALVDSDDVCLPQRFGAQLAQLHETGADMVGSAMLEFEGAPTDLIGLRAMPTSTEEILRYARLRIPVNNPTIVFRRDIAVAIGGWRTLPLNEDYDFVARFIMSGARLINVPEPLVLFRTGSQMQRRRRARATRRSEIDLQRNLCRYGLVGPWRACIHLMLRLTYRLLPTAALARIYPKVFLRPVSNTIVAER